MRKHLGLHDVFSAVNILCHLSHTPSVISEAWQRQEDRCQVCGTIWTPVLWHHCTSLKDKDGPGQEESVQPYWWRFIKRCSASTNTDGFMILYFSISTTTTRLFLHASVPILVLMSVDSLLVMKPSAVRSLFLLPSHTWVKAWQTVYIQVPPPDTSALMSCCLCTWRLCESLPGDLINTTASAPRHLLTNVKAALWTFYVFFC